MALTGQAKTDYQREYMRKRRGSNKVGPANVRPKGPKPVRPDGITDSQWNYMQMKAAKAEDEPIAGRRELSPYG